MRIARLAVGLAYFIWLGFAAVVLIYYFSTLTGLRDVSGTLIGRDFVNMWTGSQALNRGELDRVFNYQQYHAFQTELFGFELDPHNWSYPPPLLLFIAPLAWLSYPAALVVWSVLGLAVYLAVCARKTAGPVEYAVLALAPASLINLITGQNGFFTAAVFWAGLRMLERQPIAAGIAFGFLILKPQLAILLPLVLLLDRRWSVILSAIATVVVLFAVTALVLGPQVFVAYLHEALPRQSLVFTEMRGIFLRMMPTAFMTARLVGVDASIAWLVQLPVSLLGLAFTVWAWRRTDDFDLRTAALLTGTFLVSPYVFVYDMTIFGPVLVALWGRVGGPEGQLKEAVARLMLGILWSLPVLCMILGLFSAPLSVPLVGLFALWLAWTIADGGLTR